MEKRNCLLFGGNTYCSDDCDICLDGSVSPPKDYILTWLDNPTRMQEWLVIRRNEVVKQYGYYPTGQKVRGMALRAIKLKAKHLLAQI